MSHIPVLVVCHTPLNDALRTDYSAKHCDSAKFFLRYLIEKNINLGGGRIAFTSKQVMESIDKKLPTQGYPFLPARMLLLLRSIIGELSPPGDNINESVIIISDLLSSIFDKVILVSNMNKKVRHVLNFYQKFEKSKRRWGEGNIPFKIMDTTQLEQYLRKVDKGICNIVDSRLK